MEFSVLTKSLICSELEISGGNTADCFDAFDYNRKEVVHVRSSKKNIIFTIDWQPQNHLNSLRIIYIFKKNMYFDIEMNILDTNNKVLYTSLLNTSVSIKYNHFMYEITFLCLLLASI